MIMGALEAQTNILRLSIQYSPKEKISDGASLYALQEVHSANGFNFIKDILGNFMQ